MGRTYSQHCGLGNSGSPSMLGREKEKLVKFVSGLESLLEKKDQKSLNQANIDINKNKHVMKESHMNEGNLRKPVVRTKTLEKYGMSLRLL